ncbi:serine hydrolase domain-containing protein [Sphingomonas sp. PB4P5]|uniref:serine hydrolase domain-containing protein n=1 Tax=Parasphingomonas puruogangriensis TaxID=3096155 RepID=UPI002FC5B433
MKLRYILGLVCLATTSANAAPPDAATLAQVDAIFAEWQRSAHVPGLVYGIVADGKLVAVKGLGVQDIDSKTPVGPDSLFRIASMSKAFTALAILKLRDAGKLSLDAPAETYVPELKGWTYPTKDSPRITVRDLLTHSAGFVEDNPWGDRQQVMPEAEFTALLKRGVAFARAPGLGMEYSNLGFATLGRIVSNVSAVRYQDYIRREIMAPLGMAATGYDVFASAQARRSIGYRWQDGAWLREPDMKDGAFGAMGGVETNATDYAKWVAYLLSAWPARDDAEAGPVKRSTVREIVTGSNFASATMRNPAIGGASCRRARAYGMGWFVTDDCDLGRVVAHSGGYPGYGSYVMLLPDKNVGLFAFSSKTYGGATLPVFRAALALHKAGALSDRAIPVSPGLATAYDAARTVWRSGEITSAPLANNVLLDHDKAAWAAMIARVRGAVGTCAAREAIVPVSAMEGRFDWACEKGRVSGRVQRAPTLDVEIQALEFAPAAP